MKPSEGFGTIAPVITPDESVSEHKQGDLIGYARISTDEQNLALQLDALEQAGCRRVFDDVGSGSLKHRPQLDACLKFLAAGDTLVVWRLDRLGRGLKHLIELVEQLHDREIAFHSLTEQIDTTTPGGRMQFHVFGALAQFEREIIRERTRAGLAAARARKRFGGRPTVITADKLSTARRMRAEKRSMHAIASTLGISRSTLYRHLTLDEQGDQADPVLEAVSPGTK
jgi:DNA invertase Pin-like site-specific DNA recombinase